MRTKPANIDDYIAGFPKEAKEKLEQIRILIKTTVPAAEETISYAIPAFRLNKRILVYFAGFKNHISLYPAPREHEGFKEELSSYKGGKGTVQFPVDKPLPSSLITRIVKFMVKENMEKARATK